MSLLTDAIKSKLEKEGYVPPQAMPPQGPPGAAPVPPPPQMPSAGAAPPIPMDPAAGGMPMDPSMMGMAADPMAGGGGEMPIDPNSIPPEAIAAMLEAEQPGPESMPAPPQEEQPQEEGITKEDLDRVEQKLDSFAEIPDRLDAIEEMLAALVGDIGVYAPEKQEQQTMIAPEGKEAEARTKEEITESNRKKWNAMVREESKGVRENLKKMRLRIQGE